MKKYIVITGGAGFIGSNLINLFLKRTNYRIISLDNYSTGRKANHAKLILYFILESFQEYIKVLVILINVINQILLEVRRFLNFV